MKKCECLREELERNTWSHVSNLISQEVPYLELKVVLSGVHHLMETQFALGMILKAEKIINSVGDNSVGDKLWMCLQSRYRLIDLPGIHLSSTWRPVHVELLINKEHSISLSRYAFDICFC